MIAYKTTDNFSQSTNEIAEALNDVRSLISYITYFQTMQGDKVILSTSKMKVFNISDVFNISFEKAKNFILIKLKSEKGREIQISVFIIEKNIGTEVSVTVEYTGDGEALFKKEIDTMAKDVMKGIIELIDKYKEEQEEVARELNSLPLMAKIFMNSKSFGTENIFFRPGELSEYILDKIRSYSNYPGIFIMGASQDTIIRILVVHGEVKGIYIKRGNVEKYTKNNNLDDITGEFKINAYLIEDQSLIKEIINGQTS